VQVLNEAMVNCRRKAGLTWDETGTFLAGIQALRPVEILTLHTHERRRDLAELYGFSVYGAMIVVAALIAGCSTHWTLDMHNGLLVENQLQLVSPFASQSNLQQPQPLGPPEQHSDR
jgi:predicted nucleic acid-binding protein